MIRLLLFVSLFGTCWAKVYLRCPLEWTRLTAGGQIPATSIISNSHPDPNLKEFVVRANSLKGNEEGFFLGRLEKKSGI